MGVGRGRVDVLYVVGIEAISASRIYVPLVVDLPLCSSMSWNRMVAIADEHLTAKKSRWTSRVGPPPFLDVWAFGWKALIVMALFCLTSTAQRVVAGNRFLYRSVTV